MTKSDLIFIGDAIHQLDEKVRFKLPVKMQEAFDEFGPKCVMMKMPDGCIALYPAESWDAEYARLMEGSGGGGVGSARYRKLSRYIGKRSTHIKVGSQGRVAIPDGFRESLGVQAGDNIVIVGAGDRIEIWNEAQGLQMLEGENGEFEELLELAVANNNSTRDEAIDGGEVE